MSQQIKYSIIFTVLILTQVICIIKPLNQINNETQKFNPTDTNSIIDLALPNNEIGDIYIKVLKH